LPLGRRSRECGRLATDVVFHRSTTPRQTERNTELELHYPWHPWAGQRVQFVQAVHRGTETCFRVDCWLSGKFKRCDIPSWMFDRPTCAAMIASTEPMVSYTCLVRLQDLLKPVLNRREDSSVKQEHFRLPKFGDAHHDKSEAKAKTRTTRAVRGQARSSKVGKHSARKAGKHRGNDRTNAG
ncbi:MAG: hypothetical protein O2931_04400, partial [Planctomycetota bacterium]|nr:hypothetical protein [Planctomycetota bacterium]